MELRKLGAVMGAVCLVSAGATSQALACLAVIACAGIAHIRARPYDHWLVDLLESASLATCFAVLYLGLYLHIVGKDTGFGEFVAVLILLVEIAFIGFFLFALTRSLQAFARMHQRASFVQEDKMLGGCSFMVYYIKFKAKRYTLKEGFALLGLVSEVDKVLGNRLDRHALTLNRCRGLIC